MKKILLTCFLLLNLNTTFAVVFTVNYNGEDLSDPVPDDGICETVLGNGQCSLRAAIESANDTPDGPHLVEVPYLNGDEYVIEGDQGLRIDVEVIIRGTGNGRPIIAGEMSAGTALLSISGPLFVEAQPSIVENLAFHPGATSDQSVHGITVFGSETEVNLIDVTVIPAQYAAGLNITSAVINAKCNRCLIKGGLSTGVRVRNNSTFKLLNSRVSNNLSTENGGGLRIDSGTVIIQDSLIDNNHTTGDAPNFSGAGGGIHVTGLGTQLHIINSTLSNNNANADGGGIFVNQSQVLLENVTITENSADFDDGQAGGSGGGIYMTDFTVINAKNSIIHGNFLPCPAGDPQCTPAGRNCDDSADGINIGIQSFGWVMTGDDSFCPVTDLANAPNYTTSDRPNLAPLTLLGGLHPVHPIISVGSEADGGDPDGCSYADSIDDIAQQVPLLLDQRGGIRPIDSDPDITDGASCDIGAYEAKCFGDDPDGDYVGSACDVCPDVFDPLQEDSDGDGIGDACSDDVIFYDGFE